MIRAILLSLILTSCATKHSVTLGEMKVYGANEIWIYEPIRE
jgi:hypothetical protein